jgi:hypothetical protein
MNNTHPVLKCLLNERDKQHQAQRNDICHWINRTAPSKEYNVYTFWMIENEIARIKKNLEDSFQDAQP